MSPRRDDPSEPRARAAPGEEILRVESLVTHYPVRGGLLGRTVGTVSAVDGVSLELRAGETLGLVGESGCGKSTVARSILRLTRPTAGRIRFRGRDLASVPARALRTLRAEIQIVFQDPFSSLDPRMTVHSIVAEPLRIHGRYGGAAEGASRVRELLELVGLSPEHANRFPHEFSGGQAQRIGIARALALDPRVLVLDEPVSALDVSIQAQIVNLLVDLQRRLGLAYLFIAHDLAVVGQACDRVAVMYLGKIVEQGPTREVFETPTHPYTQALVSAVPISDPRLRGRRRRIVLQGDLPSAQDPPSGCRFRTRCWKAEAVCASEEPALVDAFGHGHPSACHFASPHP